MTQINEIRYSNSSILSKLPFLTETGKVRSGKNNNECFITLKVETEKGYSGNRLKIIYFV